MAKLSKIIILCTNLNFFPPATHVLIKKHAFWTSNGLYHPFIGSKTWNYDFWQFSHFGSFEANFGKLGQEKWSLWAYLTTQVPINGTNGGPKHGQSSYFGILGQIGWKNGSRGPKQLQNLNFGQNSHFLISLDSLFFDPERFPINFCEDYNLNCHVPTKILDLSHF